MGEREAVLLSWLAYNHDPFEREAGKETYRRGPDGKKIWGPTLTFLFDEASPYRGRVKHLVLFARDDPGSSKRVRATFKAVREKDPDIGCETLAWASEDPTNHKAIFQFMEKELPQIRRRFARQELLIHTSPGTPSMHTIWVLMGETGFIDPPFALLKSLRPHERKGRPAVEPIHLGIDTFYKRYKETRPSEAACAADSIMWDPAQLRSRPIRQLYREAKGVAPLNVPVLILGERGTGKTTLASWIRFNSPYRKQELDGGWPAVACGQYQAGTMNAELFGHVRGAFTDATRSREGLLSRADGDTLFLDEVGDLARDVQRLLIKALEEKKFQPLGSTQWKGSSFRLVTATNVPLKELRERLDPDFFDRISMVRLRTPPLREMPEDIEALWYSVFNHVAAESGVEFDLPDPCHKAVAAHLREHFLAGNFRDLYAMAWRLIARWNGLSSPSPDEIESWLPDALDPVQLGPSGDLARDVALRFAESAPLDDLLGPDDPLPTKAIQREMLSWIATEIRRTARQRSVSAGALVDVTDKTLRDWIKSDGQ